MRTLSQPVTFSSLQQLAQPVNMQAGQQAAAASGSPFFGLKTLSFAGEIRPAAPENAGKKLDLYA